MIHVYQWYEFKKMDHLKTFKEQANKIAILSNNKYIITRLSTSKEKGCVINESIRKKKLTEEVYVLIWKNLHRVFRNVDLKYLEEIARSCSPQMQIYKYCGDKFLNEKSGSIHTRTFTMFYNRNQEEETLEMYGEQIY